LYSISDLFDKRSVVGAKLEEILEDRNYSKSKFCQTCGISRPTIDKILSGNLTSKANFEKHLEKILNTLFLSPDMLLSNVKNTYTKAREIRTILGVKEEDIIASTSISLERLHKIEAGDSATKAELRDIAVCLGTGTSFIDGSYFFYPQVSQPDLLLDIYTEKKCRDVMSGFWGHIGIQPVHSDTFMWFPVTRETRNDVNERMGQSRMIVPCMNNKLLYINLQNINNLVLLGDDCDPPGFANWDPDVGEGEIPLAVYEVLEDYLFYLDVGTDEEEQPPTDEISPSLFSFIEELINDKEWTEEFIRSIVHEIKVWYTDGSTLSNDINFDSDNGIVDEIDLLYTFGESLNDTNYVYFRDYNEVITFINTENVSIIELPLVKTEQKISENHIKELEADNMENVSEDD